MSNESLEKLIEANGIDLNSEKANIIRDKCRFLSSVSTSNFEFILSKLDSSVSDKTNNDGTYVNETISKPRVTQQKTKLLTYKKAIEYVEKQAPQLGDVTMLIANVDPSRETKNEFYYTEANLNTEIARALKWGLYKQT